MSRPCPARGLHLGSVFWKRDALTTQQLGFIEWFIELKSPIDLQNKWDAATIEFGSEKGPVPWSPKYLNKTPLDFFFWGTWKTFCPTSCLCR
ncbi:hypothetical protein TNCV_3679991 [Trichonephila clavipes]|nr:hypothetical protein TNCV_3679991 [Trichonephila clavipes]